MRHASNFLSQQCGLVNDLHPFALSLIQAKRSPVSHEVKKTQIPTSTQRTDFLWIWKQVSWLWRFVMGRVISCQWDMFPLWSLKLSGIYLSFLWRKQVLFLYRSQVRVNAEGCVRRSSERVPKSIQSCKWQTELHSGSIPARFVPRVTCTGAGIDVRGAGTVDCSGLRGL